MKNHTMYHSRLNHNHFDQIPVFVSAAFISLLDNYESDTGEPEIVTPEEVAENHKFLDSIIQTPTMKVPDARCSAKRPLSTVFKITDSKWAQFGKTN